MTAETIIFAVIMFYLIAVGVFISIWRLVIDA